MVTGNCASTVTGLSHLRRSDAHVQGGHGSGAGDVAAQRAELQPAAHQAAITVGGVFGNEGGRATVFAAGGKSLQHARQQQQCRRPQANALVGRNQSDTEGASAIRIIVAARTFWRP